MAGLGKIIWTVASTTTGRPIAGATVEVRKQGATIVSGGATSFTVNDPGAIIAGDTAAIGATSSPTRSVSSITATNVTVGAPGFSGTANNDRISIVSPTITLYADSQGAETKSNPLTTDSNGYADAWVIGGKYDLLVTANGAAILYQDIATIGAESLRSNLAGSGTGRAWVLDTLRALTAGDKIFSLQEAGVERLYLLQNGKLFILAQGVDITGTLAVSGAATVGALTATSGTFAGALSGITTLSMGGALTGVTSATLSADANLRRVTASAASTITTADFALSAGWGTTATKAVNGNPRDMCGNLRVTANGAGIAAFPTITLTFKDGVWNGGTFPNAVCSREDNATPIIGNAAANVFYISSVTTSQLIMGFSGTPVAGNVYGVNYLVIG